MVTEVVEYAHRYTQGAPQEAETADTTLVKSAASTAQQDAADGMLLARRCLQAKGVSGEAQAVIMESWRGSTKKQYKVYLEKWTQFCKQKDVHPISGSVNNVLDFLTKLFHEGASYSALKKLEVLYLQV